MQADDSYSASSSAHPAGDGSMHVEEPLDVEQTLLEKESMMLSADCNSFDATSCASSWQTPGYCTCGKELEILINNHKL